MFPRKDEVDKLGDYLCTPSNSLDEEYKAKFEEWLTLIREWKEFDRKNSSSSK